MIRLLLDTCVVLWALEDSPSLSRRTRRLIVEPRNAVFVSVASAWEMAIKRACGKLVVPDNLGEELYKSGFTELQVTMAHCEQAARLPMIHKDPFDRMLITQAQVEDCIIVTSDSIIPKYGIEVIGA